MVKRLTGEEIKAMATGSVPSDRGAAIRGDRIVVMCRKAGDWLEIRKSGGHRGQYCTAEKDAFAVVSGGYTRLRQTSR